MEQSISKHDFNMNKWSTYAILLAAIVAVIALISLITFLAGTEELPNSLMMWVSLGFVGVGLAGVGSGVYLKIISNVRALALGLFGSIALLIGIVLVAIVIEDPDLESGWWLAFYCALATEVVIGFGIFLHMKENPQYKLIGFARQNALQIGILIVFELMWIVYITQAPPTFLSPRIYAVFMQTVPYFAIIALPLTIVIIAGEIDLSFISIMGLGSLTFFKVYDQIIKTTVDGNITANADETSILIAGIIAFVACLLVGFIVGLLNGVLVVKIGVPSLIATIGTQLFWRGVILVISEGKGGLLFQPKNSLLGEVLVGKYHNYFPMQMLWLIIIAILAWMLLNRHKFGAHIYLIGDNEKSARLMGVNADRTRMLAFALVGTASALAGIILALDNYNFFPKQGEGYLMITLAPVFLGGTSVFGGRGTIFGTFVACFMIGSIEAGIVAIGMTGFWTQLIYGLTIVVSVSMHAILKRRME
jgi:simple sugar transport system permease protein